MEEATPRQWNMGVITNVWKGKGDREVMTNQRGITVSSSVSTIAEEILKEFLKGLISLRLKLAVERMVLPLTSDHVFTLKNIITIAKKRETKSYHNLL